MVRTRSAANRAAIHHEALTPQAKENVPPPLVVQTPTSPTEATLQAPASPAKKRAKSTNESQSELETISKPSSGNKRRKTRSSTVSHPAYRLVYLAELLISDYESANWKDQNRRAHPVEEKQDASVGGH